MGLASDDPKVLLTKIDNMALLFSTGKGRQLSANYLRQIGQGIRTWAQFGVSSGEKTLKQLQIEARTKLVDGVLRRMIDIPVTKQQTVFDIENEGKKYSNNEVRKTLSAACDGIKEHYGVALEPFVAWINAKISLKGDFNAVQRVFR